MGENFFFLPCNENFGRKEESTHAQLPSHPLLRRHPLEGLAKKELIAEVGRSNAIGRPILYGTTDSFLKNFGFTSTKELPEIDDIAGVMQADTEADHADDENDPVAAGQMTIEF